MKNDDVKSLFADFIDPRLDAKGWTRRVLAKNAGVAEEYLSRVMNGHAKPSADHTHKLGLALGLAPVDYRELHRIAARLHGFAV